MIHRTLNCLPERERASWDEQDVIQRKQLSYHHWHTCFNLTATPTAKKLESCRRYSSAMHRHMISPNWTDSSATWPWVGVYTWKKCIVKPPVSSLLRHGSWTLWRIAGDMVTSTFQHTVRLKPLTGKAWSLLCAYHTPSSASTPETQ